MLVLLVVAAGFLAHHLIIRKQPIPTKQPQKNVSVSKKNLYQTPHFEIYPPNDRILQQPVFKTKPGFPKKLPKVAIIIDDIGYDRFIAEKFLALDAVFTFSILPHSPFQKRIAEIAHTKGLDIMLHLPMEPIEYPMVNPGPGALLTSMSPDQLISQLKKDINAVTPIKGVNNHMGSKMTAISTQMYQIFSILKKKNLFFIDSRTSAETICKPSARLLKIPFGQRNVFLDHIKQPNFIRKKVKELIRIAENQGEAIAIAHPYEETYNVLQNMLPELKKKVDLVPASAVVRMVD